MTDLPLPTYESLASVLEENTQFDPSQVHGLFCGLLCSKLEIPDSNEWKKIIFGEKKLKKSVTALEELLELSYHLLSEFSFEFSLVLPDDSADINFRTEALGLWCQGFLAGLKQGHFPITDREPGEVTDALLDIIEIAQVDSGDIAKNDEDESAYYELAEYVRLNVLMIFQDSHSNNQDESEDYSLH